MKTKRDGPLRQHKVGCLEIRWLSGLGPNATGVEKFDPLNKKGSSILDGLLTQTEVDSVAEFDKEAWQSELRKVVCLRQCQFPANSEIEIGGTRERATITMKEKGLNENMQSDAAAFEGWALALLLHCGVQSVQITVDPRACAMGPHFERFLYRLKRFSELFPGRVIARWPASPSKTFSKALDSQIERFLNQPNPRKKPPEADARERMKAASRPAPSETELELGPGDFGSFPASLSARKGYAPMAGRIV